MRYEHRICVFFVVQENVVCGPTMMMTKKKGIESQKTTPDEHNLLVLLTRCQDLKRLEAIRASTFWSYFMTYDFTFEAKTKWKMLAHHREM